MTNAEIIEMAGHRQVPAWVMKLVGDAVAKERAECAKICDEQANGAYWEGADVCAWSIRERGKE